MIRPYLIPGCLIVVLTCALSKEVSGQTALTTALAGTGVALPEGHYAVNPATKAISAVSIGVLREYGLPELTSGVLTVGFGPMDSRFSHLAFEAYRELSMAIDVTASVRSYRLGLRGSGRRFRAEGFHAERSRALMAGALRTVDTFGTVGLAVSRKEFLVGLTREVRSWTFAVDLVANDGLMTGRVGWLVQTGSALILAGGASLDPPLLGLGVRLDAGGLGIDIGANRHDPLGWTSAIEVRWGF